MSADKEETRTQLSAERADLGGKASSGKHPPHITPNDVDSAAEGEPASSDGAPALPANASGADRVPTNEQDQAIDDESMYDQRPERSKDHPPSERVS